MIDLQAREPARAAPRSAVHGRRGASDQLALDRRAGQSAWDGINVRSVRWEGFPTPLPERRVTVLTRLGRDEQTVTKVLIQTPEGAVRLGFIGSPTVLVDGRNPFARGDEQPASACRVFLTPNGPDGAPPWISCWRQWFSRPGFPWSLTRHRTSGKEMVKHEPFPGPGLDAVSPP